MKKKCFLLGLLFVIAGSVFANIEDPNLGKGGKGGNGGGPRSVTPDVVLTSEGDNLIFDISNFSGGVEMSLLTNGAIYCGYINGNGVFTVDVAGIDLGYHEFILTLSNGMTYSGHFTMN